MRNILRTVISLAALILAGSCCCGARTGLNVPDVERLAFDSHVPGTSNTDVFVCDFGNPPLVRLTSSSRFDAYPAFSNDGLRIAYDTERNFPDGPIAIFTMTVTGGSQTALVRDPASPNEEYLDVRWSPDGSTIAYARQSAIWLFDVATRVTRRLTPEGVIASWPTFGPGGVVAFVRVNGTGTIQVWRIGPGTTLNRFLGVPDGADQPAWSSDGASLFYRFENSIHRLDVASGVSSLVVANASQPAPSPTGTRLAFVRDGQIWKAAIDGTFPSQVSPGPEDAHPVWSVPVP